MTTNEQQNTEQQPTTPEMYTKDEVNALIEKTVRTVVGHFESKLENLTPPPNPDKENKGKPTTQPDDAAIKHLQQQLDEMRAKEKQIKIKEKLQSHLKAGGYISDAVNYAIKSLPIEWDDTLEDIKVSDSSSPIGHLFGAEVLKSFASDPISERFKDTPQPPASRPGVKPTNAQSLESEKEKPSVVDLLKGLMNGD
jgi:DNA-directed RNA polymerase specialized sigma54-like protein